MISAFQRNAFQNNAFQIAAVGAIGFRHHPRDLDKRLRQQRAKDLEHIEREIAAEKLAWANLTPLERLRIELEEFRAELSEQELLYFRARLTTARDRIEELKKLIEATKFKIDRWEQAEAYKMKIATARKKLGLH
jgi:hypothetical protein